MPQIKIRLLMNFLEPSKQRYSGRSRKDITEIVQSYKRNNYENRNGKMSGW